MAHQFLMLRFTIGSEPQSAVDSALKEFCNDPRTIEPMVWVMESNPQAFLCITRLPGDSGPDERFPIGSLTTVLDSPLDISVMDWIDARQRGTEGIAKSEYVSLSLRQADTGRGKDLVEDLRTVLEQMESYKGLLGTMILQVAHLEDEVLGLAFWHDRESFEQSIPPHNLYELQLYRRQH